MKSKPKFPANLVILGIHLKHVAGEFEFIVVKKILIVSDSLIAHYIVWQGVSRPR